MVELSILERFGIAMLLGLIVGLEREFQHQKQNILDFAGIRTFMLIALLGWLVGFIAQQENSFMFVIAAFFGLMIFVTAAYLAVVWRGKKIGATTEMSAIVLFLLGILVAYNYLLVAVIATILMATILSYKYYLHEFAKKLELEEMHAGLKLAIISVVVLPLLPNQAYSPTDIPLLQDLISLFPQVYDILSATQIFNPFKIWLMVVFICGISTVGYVLIKILGTRKGIGLTGAIGGLVSSTAVTSSLAESSKKSKLFHPFAFGVIIAWTVMFFRVLFVTLILNKEVFLDELSVLGVMTIAALGSAVHLSIRQASKGKKTENPVAFKSPFALAPALKLGAFFVFILFVAKLLQAMLGSTGIYVAAVLAGLADVDAITITLLTLASAGEIFVPTAVTGITLAVMSNTVSKAGIAYFFGNRNFSREVIKYTTIIVVVGILALLFL